MIKESGQMLLLVIIALGVVLFTVLFVIGGAQLYFQNATYSTQAEKATALAEAGIDKALVTLNKTGGAYNGEAETFFGDGSYSVAVANKDESNKILQATGYIPSKANPKVKRAIYVQASKGVGVAFNYGLQVGNGGLILGNRSTINGSIFSNGNITGGNNINLKGDAYVAGTPEATANQQNDCFGVNCQDFIFGKSVSGENRQDVAQSFKLANSGALNKISLKLKKVGLPANPTVRIMSDDNGKPDKNNVLATGVILANLVTADASFVDVTFDSIPSLNSGNTYWIMVHSTLNSNNYWVWSLDLGQGYSQGLPMWSTNWQTDSWKFVMGDLGFQIFLGGAASSINLGNNSIINGNVHSSAITGNMTITKNAYYQTLGPGVVVSGTKYPGSLDPAPKVFPVSEANILAWKNAAEVAGISSGDILNCVATLGPGKIVGNVSLGNTCDVKLISPVWITGTLNLGNGSKITLDQSFGAASGIMVVDGKITLGNSVDLVGSGTPGSYVMLLTTYNSSSEDAINSGNSSISGILYAPYGKVNLANGGSFKEITAWQIDLGNTAELNYQSGLASTFFSSGPSGMFSLVKGTYQIR